MMHKTYIAVALSLVISTNSAFGEVDVNGWRKLDFPYQVVYMSAVLDVATNLRLISEGVAYRDGISIEKYWETHPDAGLFGSAACPAVSRFPIEQKHAILKKYVEEHPDMWSGPMAIMVVGAFYEVCRK